MKRILSLDWDHGQLYLVAAKVGKNGVQVEQAVHFKEEQSPNPAEAEALGRHLRERLKEAGIAPAPLLAAIGRDRLMLKEVHFPAIPEAEEPAIVRFQALKELSEPADEVVIDYVVEGNRSPNGERTALVLIARKELVSAYQALARAAGLNLIGLTPRTFGTLACAERMAGTSAPICAVAVAETWVDFCVGQKDDLLLARSLTAGKGLSNEIRRSLALFGAQAPQQRASALYLADGETGPVLKQGLEETLGIAVHTFDPFADHAGVAVPPTGRGGFAPALGLLYRFAQSQPLPIDFVRPKQPRPPRDPHRRLYMAGGAVAAAALLALITTCLLTLAARDRQIEQLYADKSSLDARLVSVEEDAKRIKAVDDWSKSGVVWLDEFYDLTDLWPDTESIRLTQFSTEPITRAGKDVHVAKMFLKGVTTTDPKPVSSLMDQLEIESSYRLEPKRVSPNTSLDRRTFRQQFETHVDIEKRPPDKYVRRLGTSSGARANRGRRDDNAGFGGFSEGGLP